MLFDLVLYQIGSPYSMCDCPSDRYISLFMLFGKQFLFFESMKFVVFSLLVTCSMWWVHFSLLSIRKPRNLKYFSVEESFISRTLCWFIMTCVCGCLLFGDMFIVFLRLV